MQLNIIIFRLWRCHFKQKIALLSVRRFKNCAPFSIVALAGFLMPLCAL